jgi:hypothetical protein
MDIVGTKVFTQHLVSSNGNVPFRCRWNPLPGRITKTNDTFRSIYNNLYRSTLVLGGSPSYETDNKRRKGFSLGVGPIAFVTPSEVFPLIVREMGMSFAVSLLTCTH